jgi:drug/metabolite transporter (DMT)-like permease
MRRNSNTTPSLALLALLISAFGIASSGIFVRLSETGPTATAFWRGALALPFLAVWAWYDWQAGRRPALIEWRRFWQATFWAGLFFAGDLVLWHWSLILTSVAMSTLEANLAPLGVTLIAWVVYRQRPRPLFLLALGIALAGVLLMVSPKLDESDGDLRGDILGIGTALFYAAYLVTIANLRSSWGTGIVMFFTTLVFTLALLPIALTQQFAPVTFNGWLIVAGLALSAQVIGQSMIAYALAHLPATFGSLGLYLQPPIAAFYANAVLGEVLEPAQIVGGVVVLLGIALARSASQRAAEG